MNTHHREVIVAHAPRALTRRAAVIGCALTLGLGCGEPAPDDSLRPTITVDEVRCSPAELAGMRRAERIVASGDGRLALAGTRVDEDGYEAGRVFELDTTGGATRVHDSVMPRQLAVYIDGILHADGETAIEPAAEDAPAHAAAFALPSGLATNRLGEGFDVYHQGDTLLVAARRHGALRPKSILRLGRSGAQAPWSYVLKSHFGSMGSRLGDDWLDATPTIRSFVPGPDGRVYAVGRARAAEAMYADIPAAERPRTYVGFVSVSGETEPPMTDPDVDATPSLWADDHDVQSWHQPEFWPMRAFLDHDGQPMALYIEGHIGKRIADGWPMMARISPDGHLIDPIELPLPEFAAHGGVQAVVPLRDGGWLIGGSACRPGRSMCRAFVSRLDELARPLWTQEVTRSTASTVIDLHVEDGRIYALGAQSPYCCEYDSYRNGTWMLELSLEGFCPQTESIVRDGRWVR